MDRRCAGALLALAACIASTAAAPTASNQTALDLYDGAHQGCYYNFQHYGEGDRIMTNEPCLNCTCHNRMLMCYLRVCPFTKPIVPVDLLTSTSTTSPAEYGETGLGKLDRYGCSINGKYFPEGAKVPPTPSKPCEHCYCIRNMTTCVMQECTLHVDGCTPIYHKDVCCPVRYSCDHPEDEIPLLDDMTTTVRPTPGFLLTTTTLSPVTQMTQDCVHDDKVFADGALIKTEKACEHCYCMKGDIVCVVQECGTPMENEGKNCTSMPPRDGQCCPDTYICEGDEITSEPKPDFTTQSSFDDITTLNPPRRVIVEGSGYRKEPGEPFTEEPTFGPDTEGSGDETFKPIDEGEVIIPESETTKPLITTENDDDIDQYSPSTSRVPVVDSEIIDMATTEPDKGENTVPSGSIDEDVPEISISDKTTPEESKSVTESGLTTESYLVAKTTVIHEDESSIKDAITTEAEATPTIPATVSETTTADYKSPESSDDKVTAEPTKVTESTPNKQTDEKTPIEITTLKDNEEVVTTIATNYGAADAQTTENTPSSVEKEVKITTPQLPEQENEVLVKEPTTESSLESSTKSDIIKTETEPATTITNEVMTSAEEHMIEPTSVNPVDNEIDEELYPTSSPGRIPGEGDCLLDGVTYSNESIVPSSNNCHTSCRCISSIVKCDPIICSAPPDYMDNCQPMYDPPESCCPTYVCDHTRETVPPQSHSQMAGTENPIPTPSVECNGDQCEISKDKEESTDSSKKPDECGTEGCQGTDKQPDHESRPSIEECVGEKCTSPQAHCADGKCESPITPDQICDSENGCKILVDQACQGEDCKTQSEVSAGEDSSAQCDSVNGCKDSQTPSSQAHCADGKCESPPTTNQICDGENGCQIPVEQPCQGEQCQSQSGGIPEKDITTPCDNADDCKKDQVPEGVPECAGESCSSETHPKDTESCKDGGDCTQPEQSPTIEECKEEKCRRKDVLDNTKPATGECTGSNCVSQDNIPQITDVPESATEAVPKTTEQSGFDETIPNEPIADNLPKTPDVEKETNASIFINNEESESTTHYDETDKEKEESSVPSVTDIPEIKTLAPEIQEYTTEITKQKETTVAQSEITAPYEESSTSAPKLSDNETDDKFTELPVVLESESPESTPKPTEHSLVDDHSTEVPQVDIISDQQKHDITTASPSISNIHDVATEIIEDSTAYTDRSSPDITTEEPKNVPDQDGILTVSLTTVSSSDEVKEPDNINEDLEPNVTESAGSDTSASEESSTGNLDKEPIEHEHHDAVTTPKSYDGETNPPGTFETEIPIHDVSEEQHDTQTANPEKLSTLSLEGQDETKLPNPSVTSFEPITSKLDDMISVTEGSSIPNDELEIKSTVLPEISPSDTPVAEFASTTQEELYTKIPSSDTSDENQIPTEAPMSIPKDKEENEIKPTQASELPEFTKPTESYGTESEHKVPSEKEPSPDEENVELATEKDDSNLKTTLLPIHESSSEQPNKETEANEIPEQNVSTEKTPVMVSNVEEPEQSEPSVTEAGVVDSVTSVEQTSEIMPVTSIPTEGLDEKSPESFTEVSAHAVSEDNEITPTRDQSAATEDLFTEIPELTIHEHTESTLTTEKPEQFDTKEDITTKVPDMSVTEPHDISTQKETEEVPDLQDSKINAPDVSVIEPQTEATEAPEQNVVTPDHRLTEPSEYEPKDVTTTIQEPTTTESHRKTTDTPEVYEVPTEGTKINAVEPEKVATEGLISQDDTTSDSRISVTEPANEVTENLEIQDIATNIPDTFVTETQKDITGPPDSQVTIIPDLSEEKPDKEFTHAHGPLDITTTTPEISEQDSDNEYSESPSSPDTTTKVSEITDAAATVTQKETPEPESQESVTVAPETNTQKDVTEIPESQDIATSAPKISVTEAQEEASEAPESQDSATHSPEMLTTEAQKSETEIPDGSATQIPEISVTETQKETTEAFVAPDVATDISESSETETLSEVTPTSVTDDATTNIPETPIPDIYKDTTVSPLVENVATEIPEKLTTESQKDTSETSTIVSQKEVTETPVSQDIATSVPDISSTESQKEVTDVLEEQDVASNAPETSETESQEAVTKTQDIATSAPETSATKSEMEITESPVAQDVATSAPETSAAEPQKEATETPVAQDVATSAPETSAAEPQKETTETPVAEDIATSAPDTSAVEPQKETSETPVAEDIATSAPKISATEPQKETPETPVPQDAVTSAPETPTTESQKELPETSETHDIATSAPETSATESQKEVTETPTAQDAVTSAPETFATESQKEVTETLVPQDAVTSAPETPTTESQKELPETSETHDIATSAPETSATESQKKLTETPVAQDITTSVPDISETETQKEVTDTPEEQDVTTSAPETSASESQKEVTETPLAQDVATSTPGTSAAESQEKVTETQVNQDATTSGPETSATASQKEVTEIPVTQDAATSAPETSATESQKEVIETSVSQDATTSAPETTATESIKEITDTSLAQDAVTSAPETSATESQKKETETPAAQDVATSSPEISATESQTEVTEILVGQDIATSAPGISETEAHKEVTEAPVPQDLATSAPETSATEYQKEVTETPLPQDVTTSGPETSATESQKEVTETPVAQDVVEEEITEMAVPHVIATSIPEIVETAIDTQAPDGEPTHEQSTKVPESLVTGTLDETTLLDIATDKPTTSLQDNDNDKPVEVEKIDTEIPTVESVKPDQHKEPEKSDASSELPITSESVEPDIKSPQPSDSDSDITKATETPITEHQPTDKEEDTVTKSPVQSESQDQTTKTSEELEQSSEYPETTPYLVLLEEHTHKKDVYTMSPDGEITTGAFDEPSEYEPTTQASIDKVTTESALVTEAKLPNEKDESTPATGEAISEKVTEPSLMSEEKTTTSAAHVTEEVQLTEKPQNVDSNEISTAGPGEEQKETDKPLTDMQDEADKLEPSATEKPHETTAPEEEFILATTKATTIKTEEDLPSPSLVDKFGKPDVPKPVSELETQKPDVADELPKPAVNEVQTTEEAPLPDSDSQFPPSGTSGYGQEPDYGEEDQAFGPGTCRYGGKVYVSAQQIPRDDPCDFCFCFRSDIICLQQSCPPPIHGCHEEPIQGFCCPRYECPVSMATTLNVTTTTTTTTTTLPPHFLPHAYKGAAQRRGCQIKGHTYKVGEVVRASSGPCLHCTCGGDGQMKCDPKVCTPEPMLRQMIAAAVSAKRRR
ncbi:hypothetical protein MSG28_003423 [Choristoneura fumiferana]|uniref:Uncharacterized protein n=1 Tax=Choristoneura fumiferana TaxID=7141 RepID=A0ACC0KF89_CHOFU|nr:hypothetical protein MSG28_003423 [Choristoneura fumiferana]